MNKASQLPSDNYFTNFIVYFSVTLWHILYMIKIHTNCIVKQIIQYLCVTVIYFVITVLIYTNEDSAYYWCHSQLFPYTQMSPSPLNTRIPINQYTLHKYTLRWTQMYKNKFFNQFNLLLIQLFHSCHLCLCE